jgi:hypothetical protein
MGYSYRHAADAREKGYVLGDEYQPFVEYTRGSMTSLRLVNMRDF